MSQSKLFLHNHPASSYAQKVRMALREKGIPFEMAIPDGLGSGEALSKLAAANPRVEVPALEDGDFKIFDSKVILQYLEDKYPEHPLMPRDPKARAEARMIEEVCDTSYEAINWGVGSEIMWNERATGELAEKLKEQARSQTKIVIDWLTKYLGDKKFFNGDQFGFADICVVPYASRSVNYGNGPEEGTPLRKWLERVNEVPSVKKTTEEAQEAFKQMLSAKGMFAKGTGRRREYRDHRLEWMIRSGGFEVVEKGLKEDTIRFSWPGGI